jgi:hypothetical protein
LAVIPPPILVRKMSRRKEINPESDPTEKGKTPEK